jgi:hypothetical protein
MLAPFNLYPLAAVHLVRVVYFKIQMSAPPIMYGLILIDMVRVVIVLARFFARNALRVLFK